MAEDMDYARVTGRFGKKVPDRGSQDADAYPDTLRPDTGAVVTFTPVRDRVQVAGGDPAVWMDLDPIVAYIDTEGYLCATPNGTREVWLPDLHSTKIAGRIPTDVESWIISIAKLAYAGVSRIVKPRGFAPTGLDNDVTVKVPVGVYNGQAITQGVKGDPGAAGTSSAGTTVTGDPGSNAEVTQRGTPQDRIFDFKIPRGNPGPQGQMATGAAQDNQAVASFLTTPGPSKDALDASSTEDRKRANHTGTQAATTITGLAAVATSGLKADVGLGNVDNTSDANKPVSTATQTALNAKQNTLPLTTKGDLLGRSSSVLARLAVGSDGQVLTADAASTLGVKWAAAAGGGGLSGTGSPEGVVTASPPQTYVQTDAAALGGILVWRKLTGTGATGWVIVEGDTGWRDVTALATLSSGAIHVRRTAQGVLWRMVAAQPTGASASAIFASGNPIPTGFGGVRFTVWFGSSQSDAIATFVVFAPTIAFYAGRYVSGSGSTTASPMDGVSSPTLTPAAWPTSLPGTATT